jgi:hypothetical protein
MPCSSDEPRVEIDHPLIQSPISENRRAISAGPVLAGVIKPVDRDLRVDLGVPVTGALSHQLADRGIQLPPVAVVTLWSFDMNHLKRAISRW